MCIRDRLTWRLFGVFLLVALLGSATLFVLYQSLMVRTQRDDPPLHLQLGFIALRLGEVTGEMRHYADAYDAFGPTVTPFITNGPSHPPAVVSRTVTSPLELPNVTTI